MAKKEMHDMDKQAIKMMQDVKVRAQRSIARAEKKVKECLVLMDLSVNDKVVEKARADLLRAEKLVEEQKVLIEQIDAEIARLS